MPEGLLTVLKFCLLALLYLFLYRVVRVILQELRNPAPLAEPAVPVPPPPAARPARAARSDRKAMTVAVVAPASRRSERYHVDDELTVGRAGGCGIVLADDGYVSQVHARLFRRDGALWVEDLGSRNGTLVDGQRIQTPVRLGRGQRVQFGNTVVEVTK